MKDETQYNMEGLWDAIALLPEAKIEKDELLASGFTLVTVGAFLRKYELWTSITMEELFEQWTLEAEIYNFKVGHYPDVGQSTLKDLVEAISGQVSTLASVAMLKNRVMNPRNNLFIDDLERFDTAMNKCQAIFELACGAITKTIEEV